MLRDIARKGNFSLRYQIYFGDHEYTTHDIAIVKWNSKDFIDSDGNNHGKTCYTIASWNDDKEPDVVSCGNRLLDAIESMEDVENLKLLIDIGYKILESDETPIEIN